MEITEKVAYLKGLMEGMKIDTETNEGKILSAMVDILEDIGLELEDLWNAQGELEDGLDVPLIAVAFPYGLWSRTAVQQFRQAGIKLTFTTHYGCSRVRQGKAGSMQVLDRWWIGDDITGAQLVEGLEKIERRAVCRGGF